MSPFIAIMTRDVRGYETSDNIGESLESSHGTSSERHTSRLHSSHPLSRVILKKQEQQGMLRMLTLVTVV